MTEEQIRRSILNIVKRNTDLWESSETIDSFKILFDISGHNNCVESKFLVKKGICYKYIKFTIFLNSRYTVEKEIPIDSIESILSYPINNYNNGVLIQFNNGEILLK